LKVDENVAQLTGNTRTDTQAHTHTHTHRERDLFLVIKCIFYWFLSVWILLIQSVSCGIVAVGTEFATVEGTEMSNFVCYINTIRVTEFDTQILKAVSNRNRLAFRWH